MNPGDMYLKDDRKVVILPSKNNLTRYEFHCNGEPKQILDWVSNMAHFEARLLKDGWKKVSLYDEEML